MASFVIGCAWKVGSDIFTDHGGFAGPSRTASAVSLCGLFCKVLMPIHQNLLTLWTLFNALKFIAFKRWDQLHSSGLPLTHNVTTELCTFFLKTNLVEVLMDSNLDVFSDMFLKCMWNNLFTYFIVLCVNDACTVYSRI